MKVSNLVLATLIAILVLPLASSSRADESAEIAKRATILTPQNRAEIFRGMANIFPYHVIKRSGPVLELPRAERPLEVTYSFGGASHTLADFLQRTRTTGFLVIKDGKIVSERYFGGADQNSHFTSWSVGKSFTSTLLGIAIADGKIESVDKPVSDYISELKGSGYDGVPIKDILQMSSGIKFTEEYSNLESDVSIMWRRTMVEESERLNHYAASLTRLEPPGSRFVYRSVDTQILGWLVMRTTGERLADYLSEKIWQPLGMESDATWLTDRPGAEGTEAAFCCINATLRDYGRFGLLFLNKGKLNGKQIVPEAWVAQATSVQSPQVRFGKIIPGTQIGYGYQWWLLPGDDHAFSAEGVFFQFIYIEPRENLVIVKTSAFDDFWDDKLEAEQWVAYQAVGNALTQKQ
jgi:CubicO group peptidase (beta-lactamase class C family)